MVKAIARFKILHWALFGAALSAALCPTLAAAQAQARQDPPAKIAHLKTGPHHSPGKSAKSSSDKNAAKTDAAKTEPAPGSPEAPASEPPAPPYEPQALRLAEILGALAYLGDLCGAKADWRGKMQQFLEAEAKTAYRKERLAGTFNRSFHDYEQSYQACTPNAQIVIDRFLAEGGKLAHEIVNRFSAS